MVRYIFDDHDEERQFDSKSFLLLLGTSDGGSGDISAHNFEDR